MRTVTYETENGVFEFDLSDVQDRINHLASDHKIEEAIEILNSLGSSSDDLILNAEKFNHFGYIALDLVEAGKGLIKCKPCNKTYQLSELKPTVVGHGGSPFSLKPELEGGVIRRLFGTKQNTPMFGGEGFECPEGHELIAIVTWQT
jgi:hypothetical protein